MVWDSVLTSIVDLALFETVGDLGERIDYKRMSRVYADMCQFVICITTML